MSSKPSFRMPERDRQVEDWVSGGGEGALQPSVQAEPKPRLKMARLTIDLPPDLHAKFKASCALAGTDMVTEVRTFIEQFTQKHAKS